ncbi:MAG: hypothetical protein J5I98_22805 [Phaeodactylibacter sp.]|nr:hypothetical protein [Phaeodactylibacter sp.]
MPVSIPIAHKNSSGAFTAVAEFSFQESNAKLRVVDLHEQATDFDISDSELLCFAISISPGEGGGQDYDMTEIEGLTDETASCELKESLALDIKLAEKLSPAGLILDFIGDEDQDILRTRTRLNDEVEFGLMRTEDSVIIKVYIPEEE